MVARVCNNGQSPGFSPSLTPMPSAAPAPSSVDSFLAQHRVFGGLSAADRAALADQCTSVPLDAGAIAVAPGQWNHRLALIAEGCLDLGDPDLGWRTRLQAGEWCGAGVSPAHRLDDWQAMASGPAHIIFVPADALVRLCEAHPELAVFFPSLQPTGSATPADSFPGGEQGDNVSLLGTSIRTLIKREPITVPPSISIRAAASLMCDLRVSSVLLVEQDHLFGLVTDRDLRNRVVAQGLDIDRPVSDIATLAPMTVDAGSPAFEALLLMARHNIHHMPVMDGHHIAGMITATDLTEQHSTSAVYLAGDIYKQTTVEGLAHISGRVKQLQRSLAVADASAYSTGHIVTTITDALTTRLIHLAEAALGPAPIDYVWVAAGSQARSEQTAKSDQDNCLILDDAYDEALHGDYFRAFSRFVCDGLAACGYIHCPGEMMAMTDAWRQPRQRWVRYFDQWVNTPEPKALMLTCVFFDLRAIHGKTGLLDTLRRDVLQRTRGNSLFLAYMVGNAVKHRPPLGLFGNITLIRGGENARTLDLKHSGIVPIVDLARVYALAGAVEAVNTHDRLEQASHSGEITEQGARDLRDALEFLGKLRIAHQARQIAKGQSADNFLALDEISNLERSHLKNAFAVVQGLQNVLAQRYQSGRL